MIYPSIDSLLMIVDSKYKLVHVASERSKQMILNERRRICIKKTNRQKFGRIRKGINQN